MSRARNLPLGASMLVRHLARNHVFTTKPGSQSILDSLSSSHPRWKCVNSWYKPLDLVQIERKRHDKERTVEQQKKLVDGIVKRDQKRRKQIEAAGIDYECPEIVRVFQFRCLITLFLYFTLAPVFHNTEISLLMKTLFIKIK